MPDIRMRLGREVLVLDGAFGTMLERYQIPPEQSPAQLNATAPEIIEDIHRNYRLAGADCITTNTFGANRVKLAEYGLGDQVELLNRAAVSAARSSGAPHLIGDIGPTGLVLDPLGDAEFDYLFEVFAEQASVLAAEQVDAIIIETMTDISEARCAVLAARSVCDLPVFVTCTFGLSGRLDLSGTDPATAAVILEAVGAEAVGLNCGLGPEQMLPLVRQMAAATALPLVVQPNAGLPSVQDGKTVFPGTAAEMGAYAARFVEAGAALVGSCCGSTPAFTGAISDFARTVPLRTDRTGLPGVTLAGPRGMARIGEGLPFVVIGERINPTGRPDLAESLREGSMTVVRSLAVEQQHAGAQALDVNVGSPGVDEVAMLPAAALALAGMSDLPLVLDNTDPAALHAALRVYPGRALVNSVNGSPESMESLLPIAETYGAAVVVLALDDDGIPPTAEGRVAIVERVRESAHKAGLSDDDLVADVLTLTAATDGSSASVTLDAVSAVARDVGLCTVLGVSNVSHGLPGRPALNATFLAMARAAGLTAAIVNPEDLDVARSVKATDVLLGVDEQASAWIAFCSAEEFAEGVDGPMEATAESTPAARVDGDASAALGEAVLRGDTEGAPALVDRVVARGVAPGDVIGSVLTPVIQELGDRFGRGEVFLPQLIVAADAMKAAVGRVKEHLPDAEDHSEGSVVFATVKGDIHSIGKDICVSLLESQGFDVLDLGVDVAIDDIVEAASSADVVCLSALMTTTLPAMERAVATLRDMASTPVLVGGAVVTAKWAHAVGAGYADDAPGCVREVRAAILHKEAHA